jgi:D-sedoheptulose 7-phosphate isomerase
VTVSIAGAHGHASGPVVDRVRAPAAPTPVDVLRSHLEASESAVHGLVDDLGTIESWAGRLRERFRAGAMLLVAGNGGSAAQASHLAAEFVGRYDGDRRAYSAISLAVDPATVTALANDYGVGALFARQVEAHGHRGDVLIALSTSGASVDLLTAVDEARSRGVSVWAVTGPAPNPLVSSADEAIAVDAPRTCVVQEMHLIVLHLLCEAFDRQGAVAPRTPRA